MGSYTYWMNVSLDLRIEQVPGDDGAGEWLRIDEELHREHPAHAEGHAELLVEVPCVLLTGATLSDIFMPFLEHPAEFTAEISATPQQVWAAISTADGIAAWMVPTRLDPQIGGEMSFDHGEFRSPGVVTAYAESSVRVRGAVADDRGDAGVGGRHRRPRDHDDELASISPIATEFLI